jgi:hypothetical protein
MSIIINGQEVSAQVYDDYLKRTDLILRQIAPSVYITVTEADIMTHGFIDVVPVLPEMDKKESKPVETLPKKKGRIIMEGGEKDE